MSKSSTYASILQMKKMLASLDRWIEKGVAFAKTKSFDPNVLLQQRLAPDQYPLVRQVQSCCDGAKFAAARLAAKEPPKNPDTEQTIDEIRARIATTIAYLDTYKAEDFVGAEGRRVALPFLEGKVVAGDDYMVELVLPNFYFHATTAYAILRHNGVDVGKMDYIGALTLHDR